MSKLYAIRDRLLDYYMPPFVGPTDVQVLAAIAESVNNEENRHALAKTPQHFEVWRLAEINEHDGTVETSKELITDCSSLVRPSVRRDQDDITATGEIRPPLSGSRGAPTGAHRGTNAPERAPSSPTQAENRQGAKGAPGPG